MILYATSVAFFSEEVFMRDQVFRTSKSEIAPFTFDDSVASVFNDMLTRSVPGYGTVLSMLTILGKRYAQENSKVYDLGCSLGAASLALAQNITASNIEIIGYDMSEPMLQRARELVVQSGKTSLVTLKYGDVCSVDFEPASIIVLNLTLQFIDPQQRKPLLQKIYDALLPGGVFLLVEKSEDESSDEVFTDLYYDFKRLNGYNELEISQKRTALEDVLIPESSTTHLQRLRDVGFQRYEQWFQTLIFRGYIAWK